MAKIKESARKGIRFFQSEAITNVQFEFPGGVTASLAIGQKHDGWESNALLIFDSKEDRYSNDDIDLKGLITLLHKTAIETGLIKPNK